MKNARTGRVRMTCIIDASVYVPLVLTFGKKLVKAFKKTKIVLLDLTVYEACNAFWKGHVKLNMISKDEALAACTAARMLAKHAAVYKIGDLNVEETMKIAVENNITFYDASYISLAILVKAPIASEDEDILEVAPKYNVRVMRLEEVKRVLEKQAQQ